MTKEALYRDSWVNVSMSATSYNPDDRNCKRSFNLFKSNHFTLIENENGAAG
jgi:hypothetical protein